MLANALRLQHLLTDLSFGKSRGVLDLSIRRVPLGASFHLMCEALEVQLLALVQENAAEY
jgi:hypothetical protein